LYDLELGRVADEIRARRAARVLIQLPDGLRPLAFEIAESLRKETGAEIILSGDSCYGACDTASRQAEAIGADLIVHYGHSRMVEDPGVPVIYVEARIGIDAEALVEAAAPSLGGWRRVGLATTVQHVHQLGEVAEALRRRGFTPLIGGGDDVTPYDGQVLGCHYSAATSLPEDADGYLFIGGGTFHPIGLALTTGKPVVTANPYNATVSLLGEAELMTLAKKRMAAITIAKAAKRVGVLVSLKPGQFNPAAAALVEKYGARGISAFLIYLDEVRADVLNNFSEADAFVDTACPRIALDGVAGVERPILTVPEAMVALGELSWGEVWGGRLLSTG
jgi:2-(3-amino-3-carboxypropyl)histidine synthase